MARIDRADIQGERSCRLSPSPIPPSRQTPSLKADIAAAVTELTARILHKDPKVTAIIVKSVDAADWFAGGKSLAEQKLASFWLDIHVSEGTNTKDEKADYLAAMFSAHGRTARAAAR